MSEPRKMHNPHRKLGAHIETGWCARIGCIPVAERIPPSRQLYCCEFRRRITADAVRLANEALRQCIDTGVIQCVACERCFPHAAYCFDRAFRTAMRMHPNVMQRHFRRQQMQKNAN